jgi:pyruvate formate lyase activating enzyme
MNQSKVGYINKIETFATVDGPGIRTLFFLSGCLLRCLYCHNPETWQQASGIQMDTDKLLALVKRYKPYYGDVGGVTFSGGEPLMQAIYLNEALKKLKSAGFNTCLDTSGYSRSPLLTEILSHTDLVIYDIKAANPELYKKITGQDMQVTSDFLELAQSLEVKFWIRQVVVPGLNDTIENIDESAKLIASIKNVEKIELLPYHTLGESKYKKLDYEYPLEGVEAMNLDKLKDLSDLLFKRIEYYKQNR